jgi:hypothetical protein
MDLIFGQFAAFLAIFLSIYPRIPGKRFMLWFSAVIIIMLVLPAFAYLIMHKNVHAVHSLFYVLIVLLPIIFIGYYRIFPVINGNMLLASLIISWYVYSQAGLHYLLLPAIILTLLILATYFLDLGYVIRVLAYIGYLSAILFIGLMAVPVSSGFLAMDSLSLSDLPSFFFGGFMLTYFLINVMPVVLVIASFDVRKIFSFGVRERHREWNNWIWMSKRVRQAGMDSMAIIYLIILAAMLAANALFHLMPYLIMAQAMILISSVVIEKKPSSS